MENLDSTRPSPISPGSASDEEFVDEQLALLCANYANSALSAQDPRTTELYMAELEELTRKYGRERVAHSVREGMRSSKFLPEVNVLWEGIPPATESPSWDPNCPKCGGSSWITIPAQGKRAQSVTKCDCRREIVRPA